MSDIKEMSVTTTSELMSLGLAEIVDVREDWEREIYPSIPGAVVLPLYTIKGFCGTLSKEEAETIEDDEPTVADMPGLIRMLNSHRDKGALLLCVCKSGNRSKDAIRLLNALGYTQVFGVSGGMQAWEEAGLPMYLPGNEKGRSPEKIQAGQDAIEAAFKRKDTPVISDETMFSINSNITTHSMLTEY